MNERTSETKRLLELGVDNNVPGAMNAVTLIELCKTPWFEKVYNLTIDHSGSVRLDDDGMLIRLSLWSINAVHGIESVTISGDHYENTSGTGNEWQYEPDSNNANREDDEPYNTNGDFISDRLDDEIENAIITSKEDPDVIARDVFDKNVKIEWSNWIDETKRKKQEQFYNGLLSIIDMISLSSKVNVRLEFIW